MIDWIISFVVCFMKPVELLIGTCLVVAFLPTIMKRRMSDKDIGRVGSSILSLLGAGFIVGSYFTPTPKNIPGAIGLAIGIAASITCVWKFHLWMLLADWLLLFRKPRRIRIK